MSVLGFGNNINQTGVNWEDYGEFKGQNSFNNRDNGDFGFNSRNNWYYFSNNNVFSNNFDGRGFTNNAGAGTNYNFDNKKKNDWRDQSVYYGRINKHFDWIKSHKINCQTNKH